jgi:hypothetical protein
MDGSALRQPPARRLFVALALALLSGCASTALVERWKDPSYQGPPLHQALIVGVQRDSGRRRLWEDGMVAALARQGVGATASYTLFPTKPPTAEELASSAAQQGFDGVMASHFVGASQRNYWVPADPGFGWGWGWGYGLWDPFYGSGYVETEDRADYQTDVYTVDAEGGKLIWTGLTRSIDLSSMQAFTAGIGRALVPDLIREGILAGRK